MRVVKYTLILLLFFDTMLSAQDAEMVSTSGLDSATVTEPEAEEESKLPFEVSGFVDVYYGYSFTDNPLPTSFTETTNSFSLGMANLVFSKEGKVGFVADLAVGPRADQPLAVLSLGAPRRLLLRPRAGGDALVLTAGHGDLIVLGGDWRHAWELAVPPVPHAAPRIAVVLGAPQRRLSTRRRLSPWRLAAIALAA